MNTVEPIRDMDLVLDIAQYLREQSERNYVMYMFGIYTGLRISDILKLKIRDVRDKDFVYMREKKTKKEKKIKINKDLKKILKVYVADKKDWMFLIQSSPDNLKPLSRQQAYNIIKQAGEAFGIENLGTHTLRKTFGYHMYQETKDALLLMQIFNHASIDVTLHYIGIIQHNKNQAYDSLHYKYRGGGDG